MQRGIVSRQSGNLFPYQAWPTVCRDDNGIVYVVCSGHRLGHICPFGKDLMYESYDEGSTWSVPKIVNDTYLDDRDAGIVTLPGGRLLLSWFNRPREYYYQNAERIKDRYIKAADRSLFDSMLNSWKRLSDADCPPGSFVKVSEDDGLTFGTAYRCPVTAPHGPSVLSDGRLLYFGKEFYSGDSSLVSGGIYAFESRDLGRSWQLLSRIPLPDGLTENNLHEPHAIELPDHTLLGAIRVQGADLTPRFTIYLTRSVDGGRTWSTPAPTGFAGSPPHLLLHSSGAVILSYGRREAPYGECVRISRDGGITFSEEIRLDTSENLDLGYPSTVELSGGNLLTVYYQCADNKYIFDPRFQKDDFTSILYTKWELPML